MKKTIALFALLLISCTSAFAQKGFKAGGRLGAGISTLPQLNESALRLHFSLGPTFNYNFVPFLGLSADVLFITSGGSYEGLALKEGTDGNFAEEAYEANLRFVTISVPFYPQVNLGSEDLRFIFSGGVSADFNLIGYEDRQYEDPDVLDEVNEVSSDLEKTGFSTLYGAGVRFKLPEEGEFLQVDLRATFDMEPMYTTQDNQDPSAIKRRLYTLTVCYYF